MGLLRTDFFSVNRAGTPATPGGVTGTYYVSTADELEKLIGIPLRSQLGGAPAAPGPHAYIDDSVNPDVLYVWDASAGIYVNAIGSGILPATAVPLVDILNGAVGTSLKYAREDHRHPEATYTAAAAAPVGQPPQSAFKNTSVSIVGGLLPSETGIWVDGNWRKIDGPAHNLAASGTATSVPATSAAFTPLTGMGVSGTDFPAAAFAASTFTVPVGFDGVYTIVGSIDINVSVAANTYTSLAARLNMSTGNIINRIPIFRNTAAVVGHSIQVSITRRLAAGDTIALACQQTGAAAAATPTGASLFITRVGN